MNNPRLPANIPDALHQALGIIGSDLSAARRVRGITQEDFAKCIGVSRKVLWRMEGGDPTVSFGAYAMAAWLMGLEKNLLTLFSPKIDQVFQREAQLALPQRIRSRSAVGDETDI